jgi:hypothetical protein
LSKAGTVFVAINRFGKYSIDKNLEIPELKFDIDV